MAMCERGLASPIRSGFGDLAATGLDGIRPSRKIGDLDEFGKIPEAFKKGAWWKQSRSLWARIAAGEIDDSDTISRAEARSIIESRGGALSPSMFLSVMSKLERSPEWSGSTSRLHG